jgi:hypothetical protein
MSGFSTATSMLRLKEAARRVAPAGVYVAALAGFLSVWHWKTAGHLSTSTVAIFASFSAMALIYGGFFLRLSSLPRTLVSGLSLQFLFGFLLLNTSLLILSLATRLGIANCFFLLGVVAVALLLLRRRRSDASLKRPSAVPDLLCLVVAGGGATLWCADALTPTLIENQYTVFRMWQDSFFHIRIISGFSQAHGLAEIGDLRMAGAPAFFYHYASYLMPAAVESLTEADALQVFVGFQLPFGILLTGIAASALGGSIWGSWSGLAACCAIILLPDAYQQGFGNRYLSYNFLQQVNLAGLYGVSCAAAAWIFILSGCESGKYGSIIIGYAFILLTMVYKSHIFVANAFLSMIYPCLFLVGWRPSRRWLVGTVLVVMFGVAVWLSQRIEGVPTLRPDLSFYSAAWYTNQVLTSYDSGFAKSLFSWLIRVDRPLLISGLCAACMILFSSLGAWVLAAGILFSWTWKKMEPAVVFFPFLLIVNYLGMTLGLSLNTATPMGTSDELQNRPVVWVYFGVVCWISGAAYTVAFGNGAPRERSARVCLVVLALASLLIPWHFSRNLQTFPVWQSFASFDEFGRFPTCLVRAARYIQQHSQDGEVIQDSENDQNMLVGALAERQEFAVNWRMSRKGSEPLRERLDEAASFKTVSGETSLLAVAKKDNISWYLLRPEAKLLWPESVLRNLSFDCNGYRVYHFPFHHSQ